MVKLCGSNCVMRSEEVCVLVVLLFCLVSEWEEQNVNSGSKRCQVKERNFKCKV